MVIRKKNRKKYIIMLTVSCLLVVALGIQLGMLNQLNQRNMENTSMMLLDRIIDVIERNEESEKSLIDSLKEDYIVRAKTVSYIIDAKPEVEYDREELKKIAGLVAVDEIHLFNPEGRVYSGTIPAYYGLGFNAGTQIQYFLPMLEDHNLSMCQEVTPNTSEGKKMMYAITWNEAGTRMVQVGIQPFRLLKELKQNEISEVVSRMPANEGIQIFVANAQTGKIYGATDTNKIGKKLDDIGIIRQKEPVSQYKGENVYQGQVYIDGDEHQIVCRIAGPYAIAVAWSVSILNRQHMMASLLVAAYLGLAALIIIYMLMTVLRTRQERNAQFRILFSMSKIYRSMHLIDLEKDTYVDYSSYTEPTHRKQVKEKAEEGLYQFMEKQTLGEDWDKVKQYLDLRTLPERLQGKRLMSFDYMTKEEKWFRASFITIEKMENGRPVTLIFTTQDIDEEKRREESLLYASHTDELTQCRNRRAYMEDTQGFKDFLWEHPFLYVAMDVNGLKEVNDTLGHDAGDELIRGAASCMKQCFGSYGKVYRVGGDEFVALLMMDRSRLSEIKADFAETVSKWSGQQVSHMTVSCGYVYSREKRWKSMEEIEKMGDQRMYEYKKQYYAEKGIRR